MKAYMAGVAIGIGGVAYLATSNPLYFTIGLFIVLAFDLHLFTGRACYVTDWRDLALTYIYNICGAASVAVLLSHTRFGPDLQAQCAALYLAKANESPLGLFFLGFLCNLLIYVAVRQYKNNTDISRYLGLFAVPVFVAAGFEHSIADAFYLAMANGHYSTLAILLPVTLGNLCGAQFCRVFDT